MDVVVVPIVWRAVLLAGIVLPLVAAALGAGPKAVPPRRRMPRVRVVAILAAVPFAALVLAAAGAAIPDSADDLGVGAPPNAAVAMRDAAGCDMPLARVTGITPAPDGNGTVPTDPKAFEGTCAWTVIGWPAVRFSMTCADGIWSVSGALSPHDSAPCA